MGVLVHGNTAIGVPCVAMRGHSHPAVIVHMLHATVGGGVYGRCGAGLEHVVLGVCRCPTLHVPHVRGRVHGVVRTIRSAGTNTAAEAVLSVGCIVHGLSAVHGCTPAARHEPTIGVG